MFTQEEDEQLIEIVERHSDSIEMSDWEEIAKEHGRGRTGRQVKERWYDYLQPNLTRGEFTLEERREYLRASLMSKDNWKFVVSSVGDGHTRSCTQVKTIVKALQAKLERLHITLNCPEAVDSLPDTFFETGISQEDMREIRNEYLLNRVMAVHDHLRDNETSNQE
jgi:myb proto-oncogene protein